MESLKKFLQNQRILQIAPHAGDPWIANVYLAAEEPQAIYFVGNTERLYGQQLLKDPKLAFATAWHNEDDLRDRKGVQGVGIAEAVTDIAEITSGIQLYHARYPDATHITPEWAADQSHQSGLWRITPSYIKYWSDSDYGPEGSEEFNFSI